MSQTNFTPISIYYSTTASAVPTAANLVQGELAINTNDGKLYYEDSSGVVQTLASKAGALGDVVGPASATDNALARFDLTTGKLIQNSVGILSDAGVLTGLTGLTSSGSITLSSLTSGRVTFAGASGLLSDSANLVWDNTNARLGIGTASPTVILHTKTAGGEGLRIQGTATAAFIRFTDASDVSTAFIGQNTVFDINNQANTAMRFSTNNSARMTLTAAGLLGIGTTSPSNNFVVSNGGAAGFEINPADGTGVAQYAYNRSTSAWANAVYYANQQIFAVNGTTEAMRISSTGLVGIGTSSPATKLDVVGAATFTGTAATGTSGVTLGGTTTNWNRVYISNTGGDAYVGVENSTGTAIGSLAYAAVFGTTTGTTALQLKTASGNLTMLSSGYVGIGTTSPGEKLTIDNGATGNEFIRFDKSTVFQGLVGITQNAAQGSSDSLAGDLIARSQSGRVLIDTAGSTRMTITGSGLVGIGTSSPTKALTVSTNTSTDGILITGSTNPRLQVIDTTNSVTLELISGDSQSTIRTDTNHPLVFGTNGTERMTLDASGNLLVGTTSGLNSGSIVLVKSGTTSNGIVFKDTNSTGGNQLYFNNSSGTNVGTINTSATVTLYNTTSDQRLKENIVDAPSGNIDAIKVRSFDWIVDGSHQEYGMVAQELIEVAPYAVNKPENSDEMMAVDYSKLVPMMIKEIQDLKARLLTLENK